MYFELVDTKSRISSKEPGTILTSSTCYCTGTSYTSKTHPVNTNIDHFIVHRTIAPPSIRHTMQSEQFHQQVLGFEGVWKGKGHVLKGDGVPYLEECAFALVRKMPTVVVYQIFQKTKHAVIENKPMHAETGFLKFIMQQDAILVEAGFTHPFPKGLVTELATGRFNAGSVLQLESTQFQRAAAVEKEVTKYAREYKLEGDALSYTQYLQGEAHLKCEMKKI